jgi:hypothetical protein
MTEIDEMEIMQRVLEGRCVECNQKIVNSHDHFYSCRKNPVNNVFGISVEKESSFAFTVYKNR